MRHEETSSQDKKVKGKIYMQDGTLTSMANKTLSSLRTKENVQPILPRNSEVRQVPQYSSTLKAQAVQDQVQRIPQISATLKAKSMQEPVQQVPRTSSSLKTQVVQERVQQVPVNSSSVVAKVAEKRLKQVPRDPSTLEAPDVQDHVQQESLNSGENEQSGEQSPLTKKKIRGNTVMQAVHVRKERKLIVLNRYNQPIGPTNAIVTELSSFLGTLARNKMLCPLNILNWKNMNTKEDLWDYTQEKYDIPDSAKEWALSVVKSARNKYRNDLYMKHYKAYDTDDVRMAKKPKDVSEPDFKDLLKYWNSDKFKKMSETNTNNRKKWKNPHTAGKTSFAVIRHNLEKEKETSDEVSSKEMFVVTRSRKPDRVYKESNDDTIRKIAAMEKIQSQQSKDDSQSVDAFTTVMGPEHPGCLRLYGRRVTKTTLKRKGNYESYVSASEEKMQKQMEELEERMQQRMAEKLEQQKNDILGRLNRMYPELQLNIDTLAALVGQSPLCRPSSSNNNQGVGDHVPFPPRG